ncbi:transmembrane protein [Hyaloraphidium curvatum]|nr:transmembrane protein [Hyaloraphidium curvatum]
MDAASLRDLARDAFTFFYPLVLMDISRAQMTETGPGPVRAPANAFAHNPSFPKGGFKGVVRPNFDTYYTIAWLDLRAGPVVLSTPAAPDGPYYILQALDLWTDVFASITPRNTGREAGHYAFAGPGWKGALPDGVVRVDAPTNVCWILGRTAASGPEDARARAIQKGYRAVPLAHWPGEAPPVQHLKNPKVDFRTPPPKQVDRMPARAFFALAAKLLVDNPPHHVDWPILQRLRRAGWQQGAGFPSFPDALESALESGVGDARRSIAAAMERAGTLANGWRTSMDLGTYGADYLKRAATALFGIGANVPEDALYPALWTDADGLPLEGKEAYVVRFERGKLPPAGTRAFWSLTLYDAEGYPVANRLNRYALGDRDSLVLGADGSLEIIAGGPEPTDPRRLANWLPAGEGRFTMMLRVYEPRAEMREGTWLPPPVRKVGSASKL